MSNLPDPLVLVSPEYLGGTPVFNGTRVPVRALFDYLELGHPLDGFLLDFPGVSREHAIAVMQAAREQVSATGTNKLPLPDPLILVSPEYLGGTPVFNKTRVPVQALFDHIECGYPLDEFLHQFPGVTREHAIAVMQLARDQVFAFARAA